MLSHYCRRTKEVWANSSILTVTYYVTMCLFEVRRLFSTVFVGFCLSYLMVIYGFVINQFVGLSIKILHFVIPEPFITDYWVYICKLLKANCFLQFFKPTSFGICQILVVVSLAIFQHRDIYLKYFNLKLQF